MQWIMVLWLLVGCSGYRFIQQDNPLSQYGIKSLSLPMFYNYSTLPDVSADFTRETYKLLSGFTGLRLVNGYKQNSDAVLIGIIKSPSKLAETILPTNSRVAQNIAPESLGTVREKFYVPGSSEVSMYLQVIVIKKPTEEELALLKSGIGDQVKASSKIIFNDTIPLRNSFIREILDKEGTEVVATQNLGVRRKALKGLAEQAAVSIRDMLLYAF